MPNATARFKSAGVDFPEAVVTTPNCCPSRASTFSGWYAHRHGVRTNVDAPNLDQDASTSPTLQRYLKQAGYRTGVFGKFLNNWDLSQPPPFFDRWAIFNEGYTPIEVSEQGAQKTVQQYSTNYVADHAVDFLKEGAQQDGRPWFLHLAPFAPHPPSTLDPKYADAEIPEFEANPAYFQADLEDKPEWVRNNQIAPPARRSHPCYGQPRECVVHWLRDLQLRTLKSVDDLIGRIFEVLDATGQTEDTLAFFTSDHGFMWGEHGLSAKQNPYTFSIKVPLLMTWPSQLAGGASDLRLAANIDVAPTVLDAVGIEPDSPPDGQSLLSTSGARERWLTERWRLPEKAAIPDWASTRTKTYQYVEYYADDESVMDREFYDLAADPWQLRNLLGVPAGADEVPVAELSRQLAADRGCAGGSCP